MSKHFAALGLITWIAVSAGAATLRTMNVGLGTGTVTSSPAGINCGSNCNFTFGSVPVTLTATPAAGSVFVRWGGDCSGTAVTCTTNLSSARSVRAEFRLNPDITPMTVADLPPANLQAYLTAHPEVNTPARFLKALPADFKQNWILMSRSESLQTGTAETPRILMPSADGKFVFTFGLQVHSAYPGAHPNAVEYMQWDPVEKNFRFHEIVLDTIPALSNTVPVGSGRTPRVVVPLRNRGVSVDDARCFQCHSTRNVLNRTGLPGTTGIPIGLLKAKSKPNWDAYDSWGGMMPFNRDRIYQGSLEAASFRKIFNLWTWSTRPDIRAVIEQLELHPATVTLPPSDVITRQEGGPDDGHILFAFDGGSIVTSEPPPAGTATETITYSFDGVAGMSGTPAQRGGDYVMLHHSSPPVADQEGRGVDLFDRLGGLDNDLNAQRIADELNDHRFATGSFGIDVRPIAVAISKGCLTMANVSTAITFNSAFFDARHGLTLSQLRNDTEARAKIFPRRKADIQKINLDRTGDPYVVVPENGLIQQYGAGTSASTSTAIDRVRQEVFRRPIESGFGNPDQTGVMGGFYVDRESYSQNTDELTLFRYFLEPLGVSVDKWSMGVRGRSRSYTFADVFGNYLSRITADLEADLAARPFPGLTTPVDCSDPNFFTAVSNSLASLPAANAVPTFTDVQRIFNKGCIECHGGLGYPPFDVIFDADYLDLSEDETSTTSRLGRSHSMATMFTTNNPATSYLFQRITQGGEKCPDSTATPPPLMPCGGPALSQTDIETIRRWITGSRPSTVGDPHIRTVDGTNYDFQSDGEFVLLRGENLEIQSRQTAVPTAAPLGPDGHTGLTTCVSINTAAAFRVGPHRISYQPDLRGEPNPEGLELRVDGKLTRMTGNGINLSSGGRILATTAAGGIQIQYPGGTDIIVTPGWWEHHQVWYLNIDVRHARATEGVMGAIAPGNWLPALPDGTFLGPRPAGLPERYQALYGQFADAWRVNEKSSLFDYAPGTSTRNFTLAGWPGFQPRTCLVPRDSGRPMRAPAQPLPLEVARRHCLPIVDAANRRHCEQDVMVTGEPGFAKTYLAAEAILRNPIPTPPVLLTPQSQNVNLATALQFNWNRTTDAGGDRLTYRLCVWKTGTALTFDQCTPLPMHVAMLEGRNSWIALLLLLLLLLLMIVLFLRVRRGRILWALLAIAIVVLAFFVWRIGMQPTLSAGREGLQPGTTYFWKVIAEDGKGGMVESETRRFATKK